MVSYRNFHSEQKQPAYANGLLYCVCNPQALCPTDRNPTPNWYTYWGGILFPHFSCIVINSGTVIGKNVTIFQGVTIGSKRGGGVPQIGNNVVLFAGCKVIGRVSLDDNVKVGANSVVTKDVQAGCVVAGIPAKVISDKGQELSMLYLA